MNIDMVEYNREEQCRVRDYLKIKRKRRFWGTMLYIVLMTIIIGFLKAACDIKMLIWRAGTGEVEIEGELMDWVNSQFGDTFFDGALIFILVCNITMCAIIWLTYYKIPSYNLYKHYKKWALAIGGVLLTEILAFSWGTKINMLTFIIVFIKVGYAFLMMRLFLPLDSRPQTRSGDDLFIKVLKFIMEGISKFLIDRF